MFTWSGLRRRHLLQAWRVTVRGPPLLSDAANLPIESITNSGGYNPIGEGPAKLIDGLTVGSKWIDINFLTYGYSELVLVVDDSLGAPTSPKLVDEHIVMLVMVDELGRVRRGAGGAGAGRRSRRR